MRAHFLPMVFFLLLAWMFRNLRHSFNSNVSLRPGCTCVCVYLMARQNQFWKYFFFVKFFFLQNALDASDISKNILAFIRLFLYMICFLLLHFHPFFLDHFCITQKKTRHKSKLIARWQVIAYICNFKLIYRLFSYLLSELQLTPFNFHGNKKPP